MMHAIYLDLQDGSAKELLLVTPFEHIARAVCADANRQLRARGFLWRGGILTHGRFDVHLVRVLEYPDQAPTGNPTFLG